MRDTDFTKILGWPGYRVYQHEIDEAAKRLRLWVRRKRRPRPLICSGCGGRVREVHDVSEREVLPPVSDWSISAASAVHWAPDLKALEARRARQGQTSLREADTTALDPPSALPSPCSYRCQVDQFWAALLDQFLTTTVRSLRRQIRSSC